MCAEERASVGRWIGEGLRSRLRWAWREGGKAIKRTRSFAEFARSSGVRRCLRSGWWVAPGAVVRCRVKAAGAGRMRTALRNSVRTAGKSVSAGLLCGDRTERPDDATAIMRTNRHRPGLLSGARLGYAGAVPPWTNQRRGIRRAAQSRSADPGLARHDHHPPLRGAGAGGVLQGRHSRFRASLCRAGGLRGRRLHASLDRRTTSPARIAATATASPRVATSSG